MRRQILRRLREKGIIVSDQPNILFLFTDQHRLSALGCYDQDTPCKTPTLDRMAAEGVRFETAYTCCPVCSPARASVLTGLYPHAHGMLSNCHNLGCNVPEIPDSPDLLSRRLQVAGYGCGYTGKWHMGHPGSDRFGIDLPDALPSTRGFVGQDFYGHGNGGYEYLRHGTGDASYQCYNNYLADNGWKHRIKPLGREGVLPMPYGITEGPVESSVPFFLASHTMELIDRFLEEDKPFFIWHNNWGPHGPYYVPQEYYDRYRDAEIPPWPNYDWNAREINRPHQVKIHPQAGEFSWDDWAEAIRYYYAFTSLLDDQFARILEHLEKRGIADSTVSIFSSDHGETIGSHGGLTDKGWQHFEEIQRVGMIVHDPRGHGEKGMAPGHVAGEWANLLDVYPTVLDLAGADFDQDRAHGRSLVPLLRGERVEWRDSAVVEFFGVNQLATSMLTMRHGNYKYGYNCSNLDELYDLEADPLETRDLSTEPAHADALRDMRRRMAFFMKETFYGGQGMFRQSRLGHYPCRNFTGSGDPASVDELMLPCRF